MLTQTVLVTLYTGKSIWLQYFHLRMRALADSAERVTNFILFFYEYIRQITQEITAGSIFLAYFQAFSRIVVSRYVFLQFIPTCGNPGQL